MHIFLFVCLKARYFYCKLTIKFKFPFHILLLWQRIWGLVHQFWKYWNSVLLRSWYYSMQDSTLHKIIQYCLTFLPKNINAISSKKLYPYFFMACYIGGTSDSIVCKQILRCLSISHGSPKLAYPWIQAHKFTYIYVFLLKCNS